MLDLPASPGVILAIADRPGELAQLVETLQAPHRSCHGCGDAAQAMDLARRVCPELILCDVMVGGQSGEALCEELIGRTGLAETRLMFLSASQGPDIIRRRQSTGGAYYVRKPFDSSVLLELVDKVLLTQRSVVSGEW